MIKKHSKKYPYKQINVGQQKKESFVALTAFCMFIIIIVIMFWFLLQLKLETDDQYNHLAQLTAGSQYRQTNDINKQFIINGMNVNPGTNWQNAVAAQQTNSIKQYNKLNDKQKHYIDTEKIKNSVNKNNGKPTHTPISYSRAGISRQKIEFAKKLKDLKDQSINSEMAKQQKAYYEQKYNISQFKQQAFCIVIPSYNNVAMDRYKHNINSILQQDYSNYHIVFIDDASDDGTAQKLQQYVDDHQISEAKLKIVINKERTMAMPNIYRAAKQFCKPYEIFMIIDGDDEIVGKQTLKFFNSQFQDKKYWLLYTNFISMRGTLGYSRPYSPPTIQANNFRGSGFVISHLRAFYTKLLTLVKQQDLKDEQGKWFRAANDVAMYMPILQMVHKRHSYIPEICYLYNSNTGLNNHRVKLKQQKANDRKIKKKQRYQSLPQLFTEQEKQDLNNSIGNKIDIKDLNKPQAQKQVKKQGWEL